MIHLVTKVAKLNDALANNAGSSDLSEGTWAPVFLKTWELHLRKERTVGKFCGSLILRNNIGGGDVELDFLFLVLFLVRGHDET